jgi:hypothetical protein
MATQPDFQTDDDADGVVIDNDTGEIVNDNEAGDDADVEGGEPEDEHDEITFGDASVRGEEEPEGMRNLRNRLREIEKENRSLKGAPKVDDVGPEPDMEEYWDKPEQYKTDLLAWNERKRAAEEAHGEVEKLNQSVSEDVEAGNRAYQEQRSTLKIAGFEAADDKVVTALPEIFLNAINLAAGEKAAALRFYLGTNDDQLDKLKALNPRKVTDLIKVAGLAGAMAKDINVQRRKPATAPEQNRSAGGASGGGSGAANKTLERLEAEAARSGDRTKVIAYRRELREKGKL